MTEEPEWAAALTAAFPGLDVTGASHEAGAFHEVIICPASGVVARLHTGPRHRIRATVEHRTATACSLLKLSVAVPKVASQPVCHRTRSAYLLSLLPGHSGGRLPHDFELATKLAVLLEELHDAAPPPHLRDARAWCGGDAWPSLVDELLRRAPADVQRRARRVVTDARDLTHDGRDVMVHGDFGAHNVLWNDAGEATALIDWDSAAVASRIVDIAPMVSAFGARMLLRLYPRRVVDAACRYRASLPLQVAVGAEMTGRSHLRDRALTNFARHIAEGNLESPDGYTP